MAAAIRGTAARREVFTDEVLAPYEEQATERGLPGLNYYRAAPRRWRWKGPRLERPAHLIWGLEDQALGPWFADPGAYGDRVAVRGTPTLVAPDGRTRAGYLAPEVLRAWLREGSPAAASR